MEWKRRIYLIMLCFSLFWGTGEAMSLHLVDSDVRLALDSVARLAKFNVVLDDSVKGTVTLRLDGVSPEEAFYLIAGTKGLTWEKSGSTFIVGKASAMRAGFSRMHIFPVRYADLEVLCNAVNLSLGEAGIVSRAPNIIKDVESKNGTKKHTVGQETRSPSRLVIDRESNALLLYGTNGEADRAKDLIAQLDVPAKQVSLEAKVVAIQKDASQRLGIEWEQRSWEYGKAMPGVLRFGKGQEGSSFEFYCVAGLNALLSEGKATMLARPNITTIQGKEAVINIGGEVPVPTVSTTNSTTTTSLDYRTAGIILRYTPRVNADGRITAVVHTEVSSPQYVTELKAYRFQKRSADTTVRLRDGETMVIGGLIGSEDSKSFAKIPVLGDLPILGAFFRSTRNRKEASEIMIFLTARVLDGA